MKQNLRFVKRLLLLFTPIIASSVLLNSPSQAATFASSDGNFNFTDFSQSPSGTSADTITNTFTIGKGGLVADQAEASANFMVAPTTASNSSLSVALGENRDYLGLAQSQARLMGNFDISANTPFSFNFTGNLNLQASIESPPVENARASGDISFVLLDTTKNSVLDFFSLEGNVITEGDENFIAFQKSDNVTLSNSVTTSNFEGNPEFATASVQGSLLRSFADKTNVALVEVKRNQARVEAPEPSSSLALLISSGIIGIVLKRRPKEILTSYSVERKVANEV